MKITNIEEYSKRFYAVSDGTNIERVTYWTSKREAIVEAKRIVEHNRKMSISDLVYHRELGENFVYVDIVYSKDMNNYSNIYAFEI